MASNKLAKIERVTTLRGKYDSKKIFTCKQIAKTMATRTNIFAIVDFIKSHNKSPLFNRKLVAVLYKNILFKRFLPITQVLNAHLIGRNVTVN